MEGKPKIEKISANDPEYTKDRSQQEFFSETSFFGNQTLAAYDTLLRTRGRAEKGESYATESLPRIERRLAKEMENSLTEFTEALTNQNARVRQYSRFFLENSFVSPQVSVLLYQMAQKGNQSVTSLQEGGVEDQEGKDLDELVSLMYSLALLSDKDLREETIHELGDRIQDKTISTGLWVEVLRENKKQLQDNKQDFVTNELPKLKESFFNTSRPVLARYGVSVNDELLRTRLDPVSVHAVDELTSTLEQMGGSFNPNDEHMLISGRILGLRKEHPRRSQSLQSIYTHEMLHALSGRHVYNEKIFYSIPSIENEEKEEVASDDDYQVARLGLQFGPSGLLSNIEIKEKFRWLNEAVTEKLTVEMVRNDFKGHEGVYNAERNVLEYLSTGGKIAISFAHFVQAYFEDYEPSKKGEKTIPKWRLLREKINESFGADFLVKLDKRIVQVGVEKALKELEAGETSLF